MCNIPIIIIIIIVANNRGVTSVSYDMLICRLKSYKSQLLRGAVTEKKNRRKKKTNKKEEEVREV